MLVRPRTNTWSSAAALSWRGVAQRYSYALLMALALGLLIMGQLQPVAVDHIRLHAMDTLAPVLDGLARPVTAVSNGIGQVTSYFNLRHENERLKAANVRLTEWQNRVITLERENRGLQNLLHFKPEPGLAYITARVIADTGGAFSRGLIITAGRLDGVREGMAAMTGEGLIGRIVEVGDWSSRIVLITDLNSRIPVTITGSNDRAILAGDNSSAPKLLYLPQDAMPQPGSAVVTSGHGGVFPPNLPVGHLKASGTRDHYELVPAADLGRIDYVRLVDFNLRGGDFNPISARIGAEAHARKR